MHTYINVRSTSGCFFGDQHEQGNVCWKNAYSISAPLALTLVCLVCKGTKSDKLSVALSRFQKEDPTFRVGYDRESEQVSFVVFRGLGDGQQ